MKAKKWLAILLVLVLCISLVPSAAFAADETETVKLVTIGDSTSSGYGLNDYGYQLGHGDAASKESYFYQLRDYMAEKLGCTVELKNMAMEGMRVDELRGILDPDWGSTVPYAKCDGAGDGFYRTHINNYIDYYGSYEALTKDYEDAIKEADVITLDNCMSNISYYLSNRFLALFGSDEFKYENYCEDLDELVNTAGINELGSSAYAMKTQIKGLLAQYIDLGDLGDYVGEIVDMLAYTICDYRVNFTADIALIRQLNPDAKIIVVGPYSYENDFDIQINDNTLAFGDIMAAYNGLVNTFLTTTCTYKDEYYYADCTAGIATFFDELVNAEDPSDVYDNYADKCVEAYGIQGVTFGEGLQTMLTSNMTLNMDDEAVATIVNDAFEAAMQDDAIQTAMLSVQDDFLAVGADTTAILTGLFNDSAAENPIFTPLLTSLVTASVMSGADAGSAQNAIPLAFGNNVAAYIIVDRLMTAAQFDDLDITGLFDATIFGSDNFLVSLGEKAIRDWNNASDLEKSVASIYLRFMGGNNLGSHPNLMGCQQKGEAVIKAYDKTDFKLTARTDSTKTIRNLFSRIYAIYKKMVQPKLPELVNKLLTTPIRRSTKTTV